MKWTLEKEENRKERKGDSAVQLQDTVQLE